MSGGHEVHVSVRAALMVTVGTFVFGLICGFLLFITTHTGEEGNGSLETTFEDEVVIDARTYGGCSRAGCLQYRIFIDGSYEYVNHAKQSTVHKNVLTDRHGEVLSTAIEATDFEAVLLEKPMETCPIVFDGVAYEYTIQKNGKSYTVDTCVHTIESYELFVLLQKYFEVFELTAETTRS